MNRLANGQFLPAWSPEWDAEVIRRHRAGESLGQIGRTMGVGKNAVISRWNRVLAHFVETRESPVVSEFPPPGHCRYPVTKRPPHRFCGEPGEPWCPAHRLIVHIRSNPLETLE